MTSPRPFVAVLLLVAACGSAPEPAPAPEPLDCNELAALVCQRACACSLDAYGWCCIATEGTGPIAHCMSTEANCVESAKTAYGCEPDGTGRVGTVCESQLRGSECTIEPDRRYLDVPAECSPECVGGFC